MNSCVSLVRSFAASVARAPQAEAIVHGSRRVSYADLWAETAALAALLRRGGVRRGDRIALVLENSPDYVAAYYAALAVGGVAVALNAAARERELSAWIAHCDARWLILDRKHPDAARVMAALPADVQVVARSAQEDSVARGVEDGRVVSWPDATSPTDATNPADAASADLIAPDVAADDHAAIIYTSGTTGRPKGVTLTHGNLSANTASIVEYLDLRSTDRVLTVLPFFYSYGNSVLHTHLAVGGTLVLENSLVYPQRILERMAAEQVTGFPGVPSTFAMLLQSSDLRKFEIPSLRYLTQAGGPMPPSHVRRVRELMPKAQLFVMYGQTEATARLTYLPPSRLDDKLGSVGVPIPGVELEVRGDGDRPLPPGEAGEVCVRGANVMAGYYRDTEATAAVVVDGWLRTGDIGHLDRDGFLFLQGRRSDIIKSGAHRVSPLDIEEVIAALPQVAEVAVVGTPDEVLGEAIKAVVALRPGASIDALAIQRHCSLQLPRYKVPKVIEFADRLPRTTSGKVMRYRLSAQTTPEARLCW